MAEKSNKKEKWGREIGLGWIWNELEMELHEVRLKSTKIVTYFLEQMSNEIVSRDYSH